MTELVAQGRFDIDLKPGEAPLDGAGRFDFTKTWEGDIEGTSRGLMLSAGDPGAGSAGYVAIEVFEGTVSGRRGTIAFQQLGSMSSGAQDLTYLVVPGSGTGDLAGVTGRVVLDTADGDHKVTLTLDA